MGHFQWPFWHASSKHRIVELRNSSEIKLYFKIHWRQLASQPTFIFDTFLMCKLSLIFYFYFSIICLNISKFHFFPSAKLIDFLCIFEIIWKYSFASLQTGNIFSEMEDMYKQILNLKFELTDDIINTGFPW